MNPPYLDQAKYGKPLQFYSYPGSGLFYLHSYLKNNNYNCKIYDFYFDKWDDVRKILIEEKADIIGITCLTEGRLNAFKLLYLIRRIKKDTIVIFGGHHSTYMCDQMLENFDIDYIVLGEGEIKLLNLIQAIEKKIPLESVEGIAYKRNGEIIKNTKKKDNFIRDLDDLPFPFSEDQIEVFKKFNSKIKTIQQQDNKISFDVNRNKGTIGIISSRGCPFNCQFCSSTKFWGGNWRFRSPKNVVDEIEFYYNKFGFRNFKIGDDTFNIDIERAIEMCKEIFNRNLKLNFKINTRADRVTDDLAIWLKKAGCIGVVIGIESGSKKIRKTINKNLSLQSILKAFNIYDKNKIPTNVLLMVGNPGETKETINKTIALLKLIKPSKFEISLAMVFPGTQLYVLAKAQGFIDDKYWLTNRPPPYYTHENSLRKLKKWAYEINHYDEKYLKIRSRIYLLSLYVYYIEKIPWSLKNFLRIFYKKRYKKKLLIRF